MINPVFVHDQLGRELRLANALPQRIVSLVPSQTELLASLGLEEEVVGITKFCIYPKKWFREKQRVGGTKNVKIDRVLALKPDLIIANKEENEKGTLEILSQFCPVWISDVRSVETATQMIRMVGDLVGKSSVAEPMAQRIDENFATMTPMLQNRSVLYAIWRDPWMFAGGDTFIGDVLRNLGATNMADQIDAGRYPSLTTASLEALRPDLILLSSEPFPFKEQHVEELKLFLPEAEIRIVDGAYFSWYGSRLLGSTTYFKEVF